MRILLSAYACEPGLGSEPEVGWNWAIQLASKGHDVWVLTRKANQQRIEAKMAEYPNLSNLHFEYYDLPVWLRWWKKGPQGIHLYYFLWQIGAYFLAKLLHQQHQFDRVHHVTFVSVRQPSFMGLLGIPFIFGPVGGGEHAPLQLRKHYPLKGTIWETLRDWINGWVRFDPMMHMTFATATQILVTSEQTKSLIPKQYQGKSEICLQIALTDHQLFQENVAKISPKEEFRILYAGRLWYWKGVHLGLEAFKGLLNENEHATFTIIGNGPEESWLKSYAQQIGVDQKVEWVGHMDRHELLKIYPTFDLLLFPSLHDSGGFVVLEAMSYGLPVVCLDIGGPSVMVNDTSGRCVPTAGRTFEAVIDALSQELITLWKDRRLRDTLSTGAKERAGDFSWGKLVNRIYGSHENRARQSYV